MKTIDWREVEANGVELESYPTDDFDGSNTGDGALYEYKGKIYEITKERDGDGLHFSEITEPERVKEILERS